MITKNGKIILINIREVKVFVDGKRTDEVSGYAYELIAPNNKYCQFVVKVNSKKPLITNDELESLGGSVEVTLTDFAGRFYQNSSKDVMFTATASGIEVMT